MLEDLRMVDSPWFVVHAHYCGGHGEMSQIVLITKNIGVAVEGAHAASTKLGFTFERDTGVVVSQLVPDRPYREDEAHSIAVFSCRFDGKNWVGEWVNSDLQKEYESRFILEESRAFEK